MRLSLWLPNCLLPPPPPPLQDARDVRDAIVTAVVVEAAEAVMDVPADVILRLGRGVSCSVAALSGLY